MTLAPGARSAVPPDPGGPILVITSSGDGFGRYLPEILRAEGLDDFSTVDVSQVSAQRLAGASVAVLGPGAITQPQAATLGAWVNAGGKLIAMRPDAKLAPLLGLNPAGGTLSNAYLKVDTGSPPGAGIAGDTMQYHGDADRYALNGARAVATLYSSPSVATTSPAVTLRDVGTVGGQAAAFTYDLARSVVYTRQGNPDWAGMERDDNPPVRPADMFVDWVNLAKAEIPQADEQQRLLANLITQMSAERMPLPRFWYLPRGGKAAVVMTGDDHAKGGTAGRFDTFQADSPSGCSVANWTCVRGTSYVYPNTPLTAAQANAYQAAGFEIALHVNTDCAGWTPSAFASLVSSQLAAFHQAWPSLAAPVTNRTHCVTWSDWSSEPTIELANGIRLDTNYYYCCENWVQNQPGMFTGSGFPMRFANTDGSLIDVYQATTYITDESGQDIPFNIKTLIDNALGPQGYYGVFTVNMHTDQATSAGADAIVQEARDTGVPVISARQLLAWVDARNASAFRALSFTDSGQLTFTLAPGSGANGLEAMIPVQGGGGSIISLSRNGQAVATTQRTVKGVSYLVFPAVAGDYAATYPPPPHGGLSGTPTPVGTAAPAPLTSPTPSAQSSKRVIPRRRATPTFPRLARSGRTFTVGAEQLFALTFRMPRTARITWTIRSRSGRVVHRFVTKRYKKGAVVRLRWDGKTKRGRFVAAGRYTFTLTASAHGYKRTVRGTVRVLRVR